MEVGEDPFNLRRFVQAQQGVYERALAEIRRGEKYSHWMWFIFPQMKGLGRSGAATLYGIRGSDEAEAYLRHPVLGPRLQECAEAALAVEGRSAREIFGGIDAMKLRSSATLFASVSPEGSPFHRLLEQYFEGREDERTLELLAAAG